MADINNSNFRIMGRMLASLEVLKDKGLFTDEEVKAKFESLESEKEVRAKSQLEAERARLVAASNEKKENESNKNQGNLKGDTIQSQDSRPDENPSGCKGLKVLPDEINRGDSGSTGNN